MSTVRRGRRHQVTLDGQTVWLDSMNEEIALRRLIENHGFSGKWERPIYGIKQAGKYYSPDFEIAVDDYGRTSLALVEVKQYKKDFTTGMLKRFRVAARHYRTDYLFLYVVSSDSWHRIPQRGGSPQRCNPPLPGRLPISTLFRPKSLVVRNWYGRRYRQSYSDIASSLIRKIFL